MSALYPEVERDDNTAASGNPHDPDADVINSLYQDAANPPAAVTLPKATNVPVIQPRKITRMITGTITMQPTDAPVPLLPSDPARLNLFLRVFSPTSVVADKLRVADDPGKLQSPAGSPSLQAYVVYSANPFNPQDFTGPLWVSAIDASAPLVVSYCAIVQVEAVSFTGEGGDF